MTNENDHAPSSTSDRQDPAHQERSPRYAGAWIRYAALMIDNLVLATVLAALVVVVGFVLRAVIPGFADSADMSLNASGGAGSAALFGVAAGVMLAWFAGWQAAAGATPGMLLLRLRVRGTGGEGKPSLLAAVIRNLLPILAELTGTISGDSNMGSLLPSPAL